MVQKYFCTGFIIYPQLRNLLQVYHYYSKYYCCCFYYLLLLLPKRSLISSGNNQATTVPEPGQDQLCIQLPPSSSALASTTSNLCSTSLTRTYHKGTISRSCALKSNCDASASLFFFLRGQIQSVIVLAPEFESRTRQQPRGNQAQLAKTCFGCRICAKCHVMYLLWGDPKEE